MQPVQRGSNIFRLVIEVAGEFHLVVTDRCHFRERAVEVGLYQVSHGIELHTNAIQFT
jgi:hypothetical protein